MATEPTLRDKLRATERGRHDLSREREPVGSDRPGEALTHAAGVVLAGVQSWGACVLEEVTSRALTPVVNRPLISHVLKWLNGSGIRTVSVCSNTCTRTLRRALARGHVPNHVPADMALEFYEDIAPRGPAGCIRDASVHSAHDVFIAVDGTIVPQLDIVELLGFHRRSGASLTVVVSSDVADLSTSGDALCPVGIYVFSRRALEHVPATGYQDIKETLIPRLYQYGESVVTFQMDGTMPRIEGVDSYLAVNDWVLSRSLGDPNEFSEYRTQGDARVHPSASVDSTARLIGPILIGEGSSIGRGVTVVGPTTIGSHCWVGEGAIVCRTSVWDECTVEPDVVVDRCILTTGSRARADSAYRYVVFSDHRRRMGRLGRWFDHWLGSGTGKQSDEA